MVILSASDIYSLYNPSPCERRVFLCFHDEPEAEAGDFEKLIYELGRRHEKNHLESFPQYADLTLGDINDRIARTRKAISDKADVIYQGVFKAKLPGTDDSVIGIPDLLIRNGQSYTVRECKLARHADESRHEEIQIQLWLYDWLFETSLKIPPNGLEVYLGDQTIVSLPRSADNAVIETLNFIRTIALQADEPYSPVGWSKCGGCGFRDRCWKNAERNQDVAIVFGLDQGTAISLRNKGVTSIDQLLSRYNTRTLSELTKSHGDRKVRIGKAAERILLQAEALKTQKQRLLKPLELPESENIVMFDLEGIPPQFDELDKIYLWGTQVFGANPGEYLPSLAGFGEDGDRQGWFDFLENSDTIFQKYGDIPFFHWHHYETTKVKGYIDRYGDKRGIAQRVLKNCVDLLKITRDSLVLPEYSYSLKVIEKRAGFKRSMKEYGGDWSIVQYIRAIETEDENLREKMISEILKYNKEDLEATWAVLQWLKQLI
jgi:predicted RecB family nuclease